MCHVCESVSYVHRHTPVWTRVSRDNGEVFMCDISADRIQVFDKDGNYQRSVKQERILYPFSITITPHQLFVIEMSSRIFKLDKLSGNIMASVTPEVPIDCMAADTDTLYGGMYGTNLS